MNFKKYPYIYFLGIGGIGMSALARYFHKEKHKVAGYDKTPSELTSALNKEGIQINYEDTIEAIPKDWTDKTTCLIIYTPAIPIDNEQLNYFKRRRYIIKKRAEILGLLSQNKNCIAVAGTHGKTSVSSLIAHLLYQTGDKCLSFFGGIAKNYESNFLYSDSNKIVVEADEFDRSFLHLSPSALLVTSLDADHLDIYGDREKMINNYQQLVNQIKNEGTLLLKKGLKLNFLGKHYTYSLYEKADFYLKNLKTTNQHYIFDIVTPSGELSKLKNLLTGEIYLENTVAAIAAVTINGLDENTLRKGLSSYKGVVRRFDVQLLNKKLVYIDDYAHHPKELLSTILSVRKLFPDKRICGIFQPHLYSRTKSFVDGFAKSLNFLDEVILLPIYPARELPIPGVTSKLIFDKITTKKIFCEKENLLDLINEKNMEVLLTLGAGDVDRFVNPIKKMLEKKC